MAQPQRPSDLAFVALMASSEIDQKFLGRFAKASRNALPGVSAALYKVLGLSVLLSKKLTRARRLRRLDTTRDTKSLQLYHHIIFLAREGLILLEESVLPLLRDVPPEMQVLVHKLRASFYHIFVLFHNQPSINQIAIPSFSPLLSDPKGKGKAPADRDSFRSSLPPPIEGGPVRHTGALPPGLTPVSIPKPSATFLLPAQNYIPKASEYFEFASSLADFRLSGSHPIRLSVKTEYAAYLYDCLHDGEGSRKLAQSAIRDVYNAQEGMDDDMFEDAAEQVGILGKMMKRGLSGTASQGSGSTPRVGYESTPRTTPSSTPKAAQVEKFKAVPELPMRKSASPKGDPRRKRSP